MKLAIDIGSNTIKCLLASPDGRGGVEKLYEETLDSRICGAGNALVENAAKLVSSAVLHFVAEAKKRANEFETVAVATSALRDSPERGRVIDAVFAKTGVRVKILSGGEEANLSYRGAMCGMRGCADSAKARLYFDLGGGSLELVCGDGAKVSLARSMPVGAVRLTRAFFDGAITPQKAAQLGEYVSGVMGESAADFPKGVALIGAGGAVSAARIMKSRMNLGGDPAVITLGQMRKMADIAVACPPETLVKEYGIPAYRADIIAAAFITIVRLCEFLEAESLTHTFFNLRYGIILEDIK